MELITLTTSLIAFILLLLFIHKFNTKSKRDDGNPKLPPGPRKLPIIGSLHHLIGAQPHRALTDLAKKHGHVMHLQLGEASTFVISGAQMAKEVLKTHDVALANRPKILAAEIITYNFQDVSFAPYGDYWRQMRKICVLELLSSRSVRASRFIREDEIGKMISSIQSSSSTVNLTEMVFALTNAVTCRSAFGSRCKYQDELVKLVNEIIEVSSGFDIADLFPSKKFLHIVSGTVSRLKKLQSKLDPIFESIIQEHQEKKPAAAAASADQSDSAGPGEEDLVDVLLRVKARGDLDFPISTENIKAIFVDMFAAGTDTSAATILWVMSEMIKNPTVMETAQAEVRNMVEEKGGMYEDDLKGLNYLKAVIKETLRLHPPVPLLLPRECREKCEIGGYDVSVGTRVIINGWAINRDPEFWEDAETFKPERFIDSGIEFVGSNFEYLPFGGGRRICPGISFGLASVELALARLLYHFDWNLPDGAKPDSLDMTEDFGATVKRKTDLCLVATTLFPF